jgi:hypothetical protein
MSTRSIRTRSSHRRAALAIASEKAFVAAGSHLVEFLDTVSLARFTATSKEYRPLLDLEVARRKAKIQEYEERVKQLIGCEGEEPESYVRASVEAAKKLCQAAMHLVRCGPFFLDQRAKFVPPRTASLDGEHRSPLSMLPTILYLPKTGEPVHPDKGAIDEMERVANFWWKLETNGLQSVVGVDFFHDVRPRSCTCMSQQTKSLSNEESHHTSFRFFTLARL